MTPDGLSAEDRSLLALAAATVDAASAQSLRDSLTRDGTSATPALTLALIDAVRAVATPGRPVGEVMDRMVDTGSRAAPSDALRAQGAALILFGFSHQFLLSLLLMVFAGFGMMQSASASNTIIQMLVPEDKRARVISYYAMAYFGCAPIGSLLAGALAQKIGAADTIVITGTLCTLGSLWFSLQLPKIRTVMRPIYQDMGLLPK